MKANIAELADICASANRTFQSGDVNGYLRQNYMFRGLQYARANAPVI
ncbi:MAG: hypothetical protein ABJP90_15250 [Paracoccaceae bacterium]